MIMTVSLKFDFIFTKLFIQYLLVTTQHYNKSISNTFRFTPELNKHMYHTFDSPNKVNSPTATGGARRGSHSDEERKPTLLDDDMCSEGSGAGQGAGDARLSTEELLAEAAMRSALAAEKQAEAVAQAVDLLRDLVALLRERREVVHAPHHPDHLAPLQHHHHRL